MHFSAFHSYCDRLEMCSLTIRFEPLEQTYDVIHKLQEWSARKSAKIQPVNEFV